MSFPGHQLSNESHHQNLRSVGGDSGMRPFQLSPVSGCIHFISPNHYFMCQQQLKSPYLIEMVLLCLGPCFFGRGCFCTVKLFANFNAGGAKGKSMEGTDFQKAATLAPNLEKQSSANFGAFGIALFVFIHITIPHIHLLPKGKVKLTYIKQVTSPIDELPKNAFN